MFWCNVKEKGVFFLGGILLVGSNPRHIYFFTQFLPKKYRKPSGLVEVHVAMCYRWWFRDLAWKAVSHMIWLISQGHYTAVAVSQVYLILYYYVHDMFIKIVCCDIGIIFHYLIQSFLPYSYIYTYYLWAYIFISIYVCFFEARDLLPRFVVTSTSGD